jgi:hypothetical protein
MKRAVGLLLLLAVLISWGCSETNSQSDVVGRAATCAMCGASVSGDYFYYATDRASGPGQK